jgi:hypothetical protein
MVKAGNWRRLQQARASASYNGQRVLSDIAMMAAADETWFGKALLFFRAFEHVSVWDPRQRKRVTDKKVHSLVFLRWYIVTGYRDSQKCPQLEFETRPACPAGTPWTTVEDIVSIEAVEMMILKHTATHGKTLVYRNIYWRQKILYIETACIIRICIANCVACFGSYFLVFTRNYDACILLSARASCMPSSHQVLDFHNVAHLTQSVNRRA